MTDEPSPTRRQVLAGAGLGVAALAVGMVPTAHAADAIMRSSDFGAGWRFALIDDNDAATQGFNDSAWRTVTLPHDWSIESPPSQAPGTSSATGFFQGGIGWYRKTFVLPRTLAGKRVSVEFDGVYTNPTVYLNGRLLGEHPYAYTGFSFDITGQVHTDGLTPNVIAVRAENRLPSSRWYSGSGIYRNVHLTVTDPLHVARHGTFVTTPDSSTAQVRTTIANDGSVSEKPLVVLTVTDATGAVVARTESSLVVAAGQTTTVTADLHLTNPHLWSPDNPYRYHLRTDIVVAGVVKDSTTTSFGFRFPKFDPEEGFSLNGKPMKLQGVNLHATQGPLGAVIDRGALTRQLRLMKSMGVNAVRTAHNPPAPELVEVCEELGVMMMVEAFDCWHTGKVAYDYHLYFDQWSEADITEMVLAARNSPAVVLWSIGNETPDTGLPGGPAIAQRLIAAVRAVDTSRPIVMGSDQYRGVPAPGSPQDQILRQLDGLGLNYNTARSVDALHARYPDKFFFESESSSQTSTRGVYQEPQLLNTGENYTPGKRGTSSYDNNLASWTLSGEYSLKKDRDRLFFQGQFLWAGQDYIGEPTPYDVFPVKASFFGATDTAGFAKDAYHLFRSQWTSTPMAHIVPMDWTNHSVGEDVQVWVHSNVDTVELWLNGRSLGVKRFDRKRTADGRYYLETTEPTGDDKNYPSGSYTSPTGGSGKLHLTWTVPFQPGQLVAVATAGGREVARDELFTAGPPAAIKLTSDTFGSMSFLTADVVDAHGVVVPHARNTVHFTIDGPGGVAGVDNGQQDNAQGYQGPSVTAFNGKALAIIASTGRGPVTVVATSPGLRPATTTLLLAPGAHRAVAVADAASAPAFVTADASYSGAPDTVPAAMLDGDPKTGWSNYYDKSATATLNAVSQSRPSDWVSVSWPSAQLVGRVTLTFVTDAALSLPASVSVEYLDGERFRPVRGSHVELATTTTVTFDPIHTNEIRVTMTSPTPGTSSGFLRISTLTTD